LSARWTKTHHAAVRQDQCDMMGHLTTREYSAFFGPASWGFLERLGYVPGEYLKQRIGMVDVQHTTRFMHELVAGEEAYVESAVKKLGNTSITVEHRLVRARDHVVCAEFEAVSVQFDLDARKSIPLISVLRDQASRTLESAA
jgi:acyl-CoA thioester hydrolase